MNINTWATSNGLIQCMGCKGFGKSEHMAWHLNKKYGATFPYCTIECKEADQ